MVLKKIAKKWWLIIPGVLLVVILIAGALFFLSFELKYSHRFYPGVMINGESVGGKTYEEVLAEFKEKTDILQKKGLTLVFEGKTNKTEITIPATATGLTPDAVVEYFSIGPQTEIINRAYGWGHTGSLVKKLKERFLLTIGKNFTIPVTANRESIESLITRETSHYFGAQIPAQFSFDENDKAVVVAETPGEQIGAQKVTDSALQELMNLQTEPVTFKLQTQTPYTTQKNLTPFLGLAEKLAALPGIVFSYEDYTWRASGKTIAKWLTLKPENQIAIDDKKLEAFLSEHVNAYINNPMENSRFAMEDGKLVEVSAGTPGNVVDAAKTTQLVEKALSKLKQGEGQDAPIIIPLEIITSPPQVTKETIAKYHIKDLVGTATTNFGGGTKDRQHNIETGVAKITGMLLAPGQEFSTVNAIGDITKETGFVEEFVIDKDQTIKEIGGGLCQVSTTLFRAALNAGLPITERLNHAYVVPYYGPGLDATIYEPHPDFRFVNDTAHYILVQGAANQNEVTFEFYGVNDGRVAEVSKPVLSNEKPVPPDRYIASPTLPAGKTTCTTSTYKGITADVTYNVTYASGQTKTQNFHSVYQAWPKVCLFGTGPAAVPAAPTP